MNHSLDFFFILPFLYVICDHEKQDKFLSELRSGQNIELHRLNLNRVTPLMSDPEQDTSVLGKRLRTGEEETPGNGKVIEPTAVIEEESDDDDVGPMPMPVDDGAAKKKRKGVSNIELCYC